MFQLHKHGASNSAPRKTMLQRNYVTSRFSYASIFFTFIKKVLTANMLSETIERNKKVKQSNNGN